MQADWGPIGFTYNTFERLLPNVSVFFLREINKNSGTEQFDIKKIVYAWFIVIALETMSRLI